MLTKFPQLVTVLCSYLFYAPHDYERFYCALIFKEGLH